jgi:copper transport protein
VTARARLGAVLALALAALAVAAPAASAHATLEESFPERGAVLERAPDQVALGFDEPVEAAFGALRVFDASGKQVRTGKITRPDGDDSSIAATLPEDMPHGAYTVTFRVISADGHPVAGGLNFQVGPATTPPQDVSKLLEGAKAGPVSRAALGVARGLGYLAIAMALGGLAFALLCWRPAVRGEAALQPATGALQRRLAGLVAFGVVLGIVAGAASVVLQAAVAGETSAWTALDPSIVREVLGTRTGGALGIRFVAWVALGAVLALWWWRRWAALAVVAVVPAAAILVGPALAGHATTQKPVAVLAPLDVVHVIASSLWVGGLIAILLAVPAATRRLEPPQRTRLLAGVLARFSPVALWSVLALAATGAVQAAIHLDWSLTPLADTAFGRSLLVKTGLLAVLIGIGAVQRRRIIPALRAHAAGGEAPGGAGRLLRRALRAEVVFVAGILAATAILVGSPPPRAVAGAAAAGPYSADVQIGPQRMQVTIDPARLGPNEMHVYLLDAKSGAPFTGTKELRVDAALAAKQIGPLHQQVVPGGPGHFIVSGMHLAPGGTWRITITDRVSDFDEYAATLKVPVK